MSTRENPSSAAWTYRMEVSPTGQSPTAASQIPTTRSCCSISWRTSRTRRSSRSGRCWRCSGSSLISRVNRLQVNREQRASQGRAGTVAGRPRPRPRCLPRDAGPARAGPRLADGRAGQLRRGQPREPARRRLLAQRLRRSLRSPIGPPQYDARRAPAAGRRQAEDRELKCSPGKLPRVAAEGHVPGDFAAGRRIP